jgi:hypothetical protein
MQVDEPTDVAGLSVLFAFVRYIYNNQVEEEMFICICLPTHTTGKDSANLSDLYMGEKSCS